MLAVFLPLAFAAYSLGALLTGMSLLRRSAGARRGAALAFIFGWLAHFVGVVDRGWVTGGLPLSDRGEYLLVLGWAIMTLHLLLWFIWRVHGAGLVLPPLAALCAGAALLAVSLGSHPSATRPGGWFVFHATVSTLGMATLCVALAMSLIYLLQDRALKSYRQLWLLERLPSLDRCDRIGLRALWVGFLLLSAGIATGVAVNAVLRGSPWIHGSKQTFALLAWVVCGVVLGARLTFGFRGRKSAYLTITGVMLGLLTVIGMAL